MRWMKVICRGRALVTLCTLIWTSSLLPAAAAPLIPHADLRIGMPWHTLHKEEPDAPQTDTDLPLIQIFDVQQEKVISTRRNSSAFRAQVEQWIQAAQGLSGRARLDADTGIVVRIPLQPPLSVQSSWLKADIAEVYLFLSPGRKDKPHLLLFSREGKPYVIELEDFPKAFLKEHGLLRYLSD